MEAASVPASAAARTRRSQDSDTPKAPGRGRPGGCGSPSPRSSSSACCRSTGWSTSRSRPGRTCRSADIFPPNPTLDNYKSIFQNDDFTRALLNSAIVALSTTFLGVIVGSFAAYALARLKMRGKFDAAGHRALDHDVPADRDRRAAVPAVVGHRPLQHADRPDHPVPDVRAAAVDLHPRVVLPRDPEGPRGGGAGRRGDALPGVPQGRRAARGARPGHRRRS